jgi:hypothetical protein
VLSTIPSSCSNSFYTSKNRIRDHLDTFFFPFFIPEIRLVDEDYGQLENLDENGELL